MTTTGSMLIDGEWVPASNGATYAVPNPATEETVGHAPDATVDDMRRAIGAARRAFDEGPWPRSSREDRARALLRIADAMERRKEEMRQLLVAEAGATAVTHSMQVDSPIEHLRHWADLARTFAFEESLPARASMGPLGPQMNNGVVYRQPVGVCAMIPTWNFPVYVSVQKLGPALATGCTMVFKPSPWGPLINLFLAELIAEADLPPGVVNFVTGSGRRHRRGPGERPARRQGELHRQRRHRPQDHPGVGGQPEARLPGAGRQVGRHLPRHRQHRDERDDRVGPGDVPRRPGLRDGDARAGARVGARRLRAEHGRLRPEHGDDRRSGRPDHDARPGDPRRAASEDRGVHRVGQVAEGATLASGGGRPKDRRRGYFLEPTIFSNVRERSAHRARGDLRSGGVGDPVQGRGRGGPHRERVDATASAARSTRGDTARAVELAKRMRTGVVWINNGINMFDGPFGGFKESGIGREGGRWGMEEHTEVQQITWRS